MNILIITTEIGYNGGGMALACQRIVDILSKEHNVEVLSSTESPIYTARGGINPSTEIGIRKEYKFKQDCLNHSKADVVIAFGGRYNGYYASLLADRLGKRFILALRGSDVNISKWSIEDSWYLRESARKANKIICLSNEMIHNIKCIYPEANGKVQIIPNEFEGEASKIIFHDLSKEVVIGTAATHLNEKKGVGNLILMLAYFKNISKAKVRLDLVGEIDKDLLHSYKEEVRKYHLEENIVFLGYQPRDILKNTMKEWDFYVQGSVCEGHPNAISECLQCGTGFISSQTGFIAELLHNQFPELFFDCFQPEMMAIKLKELCSVSNLEKRFQEAYNVLRQHCSNDVVAQKWLDLLSYNKSAKENFDIENIVCVGLHDVIGDVHDSITTPTSVFHDFVEYIASKGYGICSMHDYLGKSKEERKQWIVCTFDDGYKSLLGDALNILKKHHFTATVFVCSGLIGQNNSWNNKDAKLREHLDISDLNILKNEGWEIGSHGVLHKNLLKLSDLDVDFELSESKKSIEQLIGYCETYAYPYGAYNKFIRHSVEKYYAYAFTVDEGGTSLVIDRHQLKRYSISEIYKMIEA